MPRGVPGPVKKTKGKPVDNLPKNTDGSVKAGPGRPKGRMNKFSGEVKQMILDGINSAHEHGMAFWVRELATDTPTSAAALLGRLIPVSTDVKMDLKHEVTFKFD
jgi:hypothetical protein